MKLKQINGQDRFINLHGKSLEHFNNTNNYTAFILDEWETQPYRQYIKAGSVILDIGANVGLFALHVLPIAQKIICVEPTPEHMAILKELVPQAVPEEAALNVYTGRARFRREPVNTTMNSLSDRQDSFEVSCITLKDLCDKHGLTKVDFCKVDIEGGEWGALTVERINEAKGIIKSFFVELHPRTGEAQREMAERFLQCGYKVEHITYNGSIFCYEDTDNSL